MREGRDRLEGIPRERAKDRTQSRGALPPDLERVNQAAQRGRQTRFTALLHHVDGASLRRAFERQRRTASAGVDGETVASYEPRVEETLEALCARLHTGRDRPMPVRRVYIPKADGGERPLGIPALEDKIVQSAVAEVLNAIYEVDFKNFSYGFRPGRDAHPALAALHTGLMTQDVNWVLDADDFVLGFPYRSDAQAMWAALKQRLGKFGLTLHEDKTRLIEFGRLPAISRARRGQKRPETFNFLGFTHYCGWTRNGRFVVKRKTQSKRLTRKLRELREQAWQRMHIPVAAQHRWLCSVLRGHYAYYGLPCNYPALQAFTWQVCRLWFRTLRRRDRQRALTWARFAELLERLPLPTPKITHPWQPAGARLG